jgi:hypothetical protein
LSGSTATVTIVHSEVDSIFEFIRRESGVQPRVKTGEDEDLALERREPRIRVIGGSTAALTKSTNLFMIY